MDEWLKAESKNAAKKTAGDPIIDPASKRDLKGEVETLERLLYLVDQQAESMARDDIQSALPILEQRQSLSAQRNAALVQLRRQGRTEDDSIPRPEVERIAHALAFNAALGLQRLSDELADKLSGITDPAAIRDILTRGLVATAYLAPFEQAVGLDAGHGLPHWVVEAMVRASKEMVE